MTAINRPNTAQVGTIVWLGSEVMFFAGLFAIYFTLRSVSPELWAEQSDKLNITFSLINTIILVSSSFTCQAGVFAAERLQAPSSSPSTSDSRPTRTARPSTSRPDSTVCT